MLFGGRLLAILFVPSLACAAAPGGVAASQGSAKVSAAASRDAGGSGPDASRDAQVATATPEVAPGPSFEPGPERAPPSCESALRYLLQRGADLQHLLTAKAAHAILCADREPDLRPKALAELLKGEDESVAVPVEWVAAAQRWGREPSADPIVPHFLAVNGSVEAIPRLEKLAQTDAVFYMSLGRLPAPEARLVLERALHAPQPRVRAIAAAALQMQGQAACPALQTVAEGEGEAEALISQLYAMAYLRCPGADATAARHLGHTDAEVRVASVAVLGRLPAAAHPTPLLRLLQDEDATVRDAAAMALAGQPPELSWVKQLVAAALQKASPRLTVAAIDRASALGTPAQLLAVRQLLTDEARQDADVMSQVAMVQRPGFAPLTARELRQLAAQGTAELPKHCQAEASCQQLMVEASLALARTRDRAAIPVLGDLAANGEQDEVRAAAALALWALDREEAKKVLLGHAHDKPLKRYTWRAMPILSNRDRVEPTENEAAVEVVLADPGTPRPMLHVKAKPTTPGQRGRLRATVYIVDGDLKLPVEHQEAWLGEQQAMTLSLGELNNFERARPLQVEVVYDGDVATIPLPALTTWVCTQFSGHETAGTRVRMQGRRDTLSSYTDILGLARFAGIVPGPVSVYLDGSVPEADYHGDATPKKSKRKSRSQRPAR